MSQRIQYLRQHEINKQQWDACMDRATNSRLYGYSFYLDEMAIHWDALVLNDYEAVMPLPWKNKWGITYLYEPFLCAMLGIFGNAPGPSLINSFLAKIPARFRYWDISCNPGNQVTAQPWKVITRQNFVLPLQLPYETLYAGFNENTKRNIKKAAKSNAVIGKPALQEVLALAQQQMEKRDHYQPDQFDRFAKLYDLLAGNNAAVTYGVYDEAKHLLSAAVFFTWRNRAYYILPGNHPAGRQSGASHALLDAFIRDHAGSERILDFEGSDIESVALFYRGFGAQAELYPAIRYNRLPAIIKWLKK